MWYALLIMITVCAIIYAMICRINLRKIRAASWTPFERERTLLLMDDGSEIPLAESESEWDLRWKIPEGRKPTAFVLHDVQPGLLPLIRVRNTHLSRKESSAIPYTPQHEYRHLPDGRMVEDVIIRWQEPDDPGDVIKIDVHFCQFTPRATPMREVHPYAMPQNKPKTTVQFEWIPGFYRTLEVFLAP